MKRSFQHVASLAALSLLSACASLSSNIGGDFACPAPKGRCAPASVIDAQALGRNEEYVPTDARRSPSTHIAVSGNALGARTGETILKIVLPAHVDRAGILRDEAAVYTVVVAPRWVASIAPEVSTSGARATAKRIERSNALVLRKRKGKAASAPKAGPVETHDAASQDIKQDTLSVFAPDQLDEMPSSQDQISSSREASPLTLREAVAGASLPAIEGFASSSPARTPHPDRDDGAALPTPDAIAAARAGHRIGSRTLSTETGSPPMGASRDAATGIGKATEKPKAKAKRGQQPRAKQRASAKRTYRKQTHKKGPRS
jgi:conjugal transfer pilus assembly protein TraV